MKYTFFFLFFPLISFAQLEVEHHENFKKCNTLLVRAEGEVEEKISLLQDFFKEQQIITRVDRENGRVITDGFNINHNAATYRMVILVYPSRVELRTFYDKSLFRDLSKRVDYRRSQPKWNGFLFMEKVGEMLSEELNRPLIYGWERADDASFVNAR